MRQRRRRRRMIRRLVRQIGKSALLLAIILAVSAGLVLGLDAKSQPKAVTAANWPQAGASVGIKLASREADILADIKNGLPIAGLSCVMADMADELRMLTAADAKVERFDEIKAKSALTVEASETAGSAAESASSETDSATGTTATEKNAIWTGWAYFESGKDCWKQVGGDGGNAYGRFQLDARYSLADFLCYAAESNEAFAGLSRYYRKEDGRAVLKTLDGLDSDWAWLCAVYGEEFYRAQAEFAYETFYCPMRNTLLKEYGIDLDSYSPVLRGTVWSVAVRNGCYVSRIYSVTDTYYPGIDEAEWLREIYAIETWRHTGQEVRWGENQLNAALETLDLLRDEAKIEAYETFEAGVWQDLTRIELL